MTVRVNLLPSEVKASARASRVRLLTAAGAGALVLALGGVWFLQQGQVTVAEDDLAAAEQRNASLQAEITELEPFAALELAQSEATDSVVTALAREASYAGVLQDLSAVLPPNAELTDLTITMAPEPQAPSPGGTRAVEGTLVAQGRVLVGIAPGVERVLMAIDRVAGFDNAYVTTSNVDEDGVVTFTLEAELGPEVLTERYSLQPQEVRQ